MENKDPAITLNPAQIKRKYVCDGNSCRIVEDNTIDITDLNNNKIKQTRSQIEKPFPYPTEEGWVIYGALWCPFCRGANSLLEEKNIEFTYYDIDKIEGYTKNDVKDKLSDLTNDYKTIPMVFNNGEFIGGYVDLKRYLKN